MFVSNSDMIVVVLSYFILLFYYPLEICFFFRERQKGVFSYGREKGKSRGRGNHNQVIVGEKKYPFLKKFTYTKQVCIGVIPSLRKDANFLLLTSALLTITCKQLQTQRKCFCKCATCTQISYIDRNDSVSHHHTLKG